MNRFLSLRRATLALSILGAVFVMVWGLVFSERGHLKFRRIKAHEQVLSSELEKMRAYRDQLLTERKDLQEGGRATEKVAREKYLFHAPGEVVVLVPQTLTQPVDNKGKDH